MKNGFFQINQLGIGLLVRKCAEIGQKWDFRALFSEIYMNIEDSSIFEHNQTSAPIAQLAERWTFFIWFWPDHTWPEKTRVQFPGEEHDFFFFVQINFSKHFLYALVSYIDII